ncbi:hypothetical protein FJZ55_00905 [Candidatus Woesearchaeota archaeon]|nr:hypothetical protein [Candidatus Woesearchaeota archaeon]
MAEYKSRTDKSSSAGMARLAWRIQTHRACQRMRPGCPSVFNGSLTGFLPKMAYDFLAESGKILRTA